MPISVRDSLVLRSPDALISALPHLLGFAPHESLVVIWIGAGRVLLTQRIDLAGRRADPEAWQAALWNHASARAAEEIVAVLATADDSHVDVVESLRAAATERDVFLRDVLVVDEGRWRSALCDDELCCPSTGRSVDPGVRAEVDAEFAVLGSAPMADRAAVIRSMQRDSNAVHRLTQTLADITGATGIPNQFSEDSKDALIDRIRGLLAAPGAAARRGYASMPDQEALELLSALSDVRVRDTVLWHLCHDDPSVLPAALTLTTNLLRTAPDPLLPAVATTCAIVAWLLGDGVRAATAVEGALQAQPDYNLAVLVAHALKSGLPPSTWRQAMASVTRDECRHGLSANESARA